MQTQFRPEQLVFAPVEGRSVVASFTGGAITSDAGALLLGATDRAIGLVERFTGCFQDARDPDLIEHEMATLIGERVFGIALGYEDLVDHDQLRHDPGACRKLWRGAQDGLCPTPVSHFIPDFPDGGVWH